MYKITKIIPMGFWGFGVLGFWGREKLLVRLIQLVR